MKYQFQLQSIFKYCKKFRFFNSTKDSTIEKEQNSSLQVTAIGKCCFSCPSLLCAMQVLYVCSIFQLYILRFLLLCLSKYFGCFHFVKEQFQTRLYADAKKKSESTKRNDNFCILHTLFANTIMLVNLNSTCKMDFLFSTHTQLHAREHFFPVDSVDLSSAMSFNIYTIHAVAL